MIDEATRNAIFIDIHASVARASAWVLETLGREDPRYPPEGGLTAEERQALADMQLSPRARSGLRKLVASACVTPVFDFLCLLDGVADPETGSFDPWLGLTLAPKPEEDEPMLHDELYESYWLYKEQRESHS